MTQYLVTRLFDDGKATDRVILFHAPRGRSTHTHIKRIEAISNWRHVGSLDSERDDLDRVTGDFGVTDAVLLKRTGLDLLHMGCAAA